MYHSHVSMIYDTDTPEMYQWYWCWYCTKNVSWYMYHWYSPTLSGHRPIKRKPKAPFL